MKKWRKGLGKGYFLQPTILTDVPLDSAAWTEEIFGPVVSIRAFTSEAEAVGHANDSRFGLAAAVMSKDDARTERVTRSTPLSSSESRRSVFGRNDTDSAERGGISIAFILVVQ